MDKRLLLAVLFVTMSCMFMKTCAQTNTTTAASTTTNTATTTTAAPTTTNTANTTTAAPTTTNTATTTTAAPTTTNTATTTTAAPTTTNTATTTTAAPTTTNTATTTTAAPTTMTMTTAAPATVGNLNMPVSSDGCGSLKLCIADPSDCNPPTDSTCIFSDIRRQRTTNIDFSLSGQSEGYIALTLSRDATLGGNDITYVCANDNGFVRFFGALLDNNVLTTTEQLNVNNVRGRVNGTTIQCTFSATVQAPETRTINLALAIITGTFTSTSGALGTPVVQLRTGVVDLTNPSQTVTNQLATGNTAHGITFQQSMTQVLLITVGVLSLAML